MKTALSSLITLAAATPALAHADGSFHSHGVELYVALAALGLIAAVVIHKNR